MNRWVSFDVPSSYRGRSRISNECYRLYQWLLRPKRSAPCKVDSSVQWKYLLLATHFSQ